MGVCNPQRLQLRDQKDASLTMEKKVFREGKGTIGRAIEARKERHSNIERGGKSGQNRRSHQRRVMHRLERFDQKEKAISP